MEGRFAEARALVDKAIGITRELGFAGGEHACLESRANVERRAGNKEHFLACAREFYEDDARDRRRRGVVDGGCVPR